MHIYQWVYWYIYIYSTVFTYYYKPMMKRRVTFTLPWLLLLCSIHCARLVSCDNIPSHNVDTKVHIVYMGEGANDFSHDSTHHIFMLSTILGRDASKSVIRSYKNFNGFAAHLTLEDKQRVAAARGVVSVFPSKKNIMETTRSWDFIDFTQQAKRSTNESDIIVGVFHSGLCPESISFNDKGIPNPPKKWRGICQSSSQNPFPCNKKVIGARYYRSDEDFPPEDIESPRDTNGHGTHCASVAAGRVAREAELVGFASGTARGGVPSARIAVYKVCWSDGCDDADILSAFDDAISDGVDIISISVGGGKAHRYFRDSISIGSFYAMINGVLTVSSAGNAGLGLSTTAKVAPWLVSVAATTIDRKYSTPVVLGNKKVYKGVSIINTFDKRDVKYPLIYGGDVPAEGSTKAKSRYCIKDSIDPSKVKGKIVLCDKSGKVAENTTFRAEAAGLVTRDGAVTDSARSPPLSATRLGTDDGTHVYSYYESDKKKATATIKRSEELKNELAPYVASFSSRGPNMITPVILKPDISAPGVHILGAWPPETSVSGIDGDRRKVKFNIKSGTSMACPHVSGIAAYIKSFHRKWSPARIQSALMTTARPLDKKKNPNAELAYGAGQLNASKVVDPGLVYDLDPSDYIPFLRGQGYKRKIQQIITITGHNKIINNATSSVFEATKSERAEDLNVPSFALAAYGRKSFSKTYHRTVTNVGPLAKTTYVAEIRDAPLGIKIKVEPSKLEFTNVEESLPFDVTIKGRVTSETASASLIWKDASHEVRSPILIFDVKKAIPQVQYI